MLQEAVSGNRTFNRGLTEIQTYNPQRTPFDAMAISGQTIYYTAAIFQDVDVRRVSHFGIGAGGINLLLAFVVCLLDTLIQ